MKQAARNDENATAITGAAKKQRTGAPFRAARSALTPMMINTGPMALPSTLMPPPASQRAASQAPASEAPALQALPSQRGGAKGLGLVPPSLVRPGTPRPQAARPSEVRAPGVSRWAWSLLGPHVHARRT
jgi:hypothetical protein